MNHDEFDIVRRTPAGQISLAAAELSGPNRTLAYGYTCERHSWHCYLQDGQLHVLAYAHDGTPLWHHTGPSLAADLLAPDKRVYPHYTDRQFAELLLARGKDLPYTTFNEEVYAATAHRPFHGAVAQLDADGSILELHPPRPRLSS